MKKTLLLSTVLASLLTANEIGTVVVTANKTEQSIKDVTSNIEVITKEEIAEKHYTDLAELVSSVNGLNYTRNGGVGSTTSVFLRGMSTSRVLLLIDGVRFQDPSSTSGANFAHVNLANVERVEILKGASSSIWGSDAAAGVINIITKEAEGGVNSSVNVEAGSYGLRKVDASLDLKDEKNSFALSVSRLESDGFSSQSPKNEDVEKYERDSYKNSTVNLKTKTALTDATDLKFSLTNINGDKEYDSYNNPDDDTLKSDTNSKLYSLGVNTRADIHNIELSHSVSDFSREEEGTTWGVKTFNGKTLVTEVYDNISYMDNATLVVGAKAKETKVDYIEAFGGGDKKDFTSKSIFLSNQNKFGNIIFNQAIRSTDLSDFEDKTTGKVGAKINVNKDLSFSANYGTAYNAPNLINVINPWGASNFNLKPETIKSFDIAVEYKALSFTYFNQEVENLLFWNTNNTFDNYSDDFYDNGDGTSKIKGFEVEAQEELPSLRSVVKVTYASLDAKNEKGEDLKRRAKETARVFFDHYPNSKLHVNFNAEYVGKRYDRDNKQGKQTGEYTVVNSVINYQLTKNLKTYIKLENLTDKNYQVVDGYATAGRSYYVGFNANF